MSVARVKRAFVWCAAYYVLTFVSVLYLYPLENVKGWDGLLVFVPLLLLGISSETMTGKKTPLAQRIKRYAASNFSAKAVTFVLAECIYRKLVGETIGRCFFGGIACLCLCSVALEIKMFMIIKSDGDKK